MDCYNVASSILGGINALISIGTMIYTHSLTNSFTAAACVAYAGSGGALAAVLGSAGWFLITAASWMGMISLALLIIVPLANLMMEYLEKDAMDYVTPPKSVVETNNKRICLFDVVMGSNGKPGDVSAGMGKEAGKWEWTWEHLDYRPDHRPRWNALYYTLDPDAGSPICLDDDGSCFKVQHNDFSVPTGYAPLRTFNEDAAANMNSYVNEENADGIFVFYKTEETFAKINQPETNDAENSGKYISKMMLSVGESETEAKTNLTRDGYKIIDENLSPNVSKSYTYLGYKVQTVEDKAVCDRRIAPKTNDSALSYGNAGYANAGTLKNGDSMYYSSYTCVGDALTADFMIVHDVKDAKEGYEPITTFGGLPYNFNHVMDFDVSSIWGFPLELFDDGFDKAKEKLGKPVYVFFRPSKTYTSKKDGSGEAAQKYLSGLAVFECVPQRSGKINGTN